MHYTLVKIISLPSLTPFLSSLPSTHLVQILLSESLDLLRAVVPHVAHVARLALVGVSDALHLLVAAVLDAGHLLVIALAQTGQLERPPLLHRVHHRLHLLSARREFIGAADTAAAPEGGQRGTEVTEVRGYRGYIGQRGQRSQSSEVIEVRGHRGQRSERPRGHRVRGSEVIEDTEQRSVDSAAWP